MHTYIIYWMLSNFGQIGSPTAELSAIERLKKLQRLTMRKMVSPHLSVVIGPIF